jgi:hypothetical protein
VLPQLGLTEVQLVGPANTIAAGIGSHHSEQPIIAQGTERVSLEEWRTIVYLRASFSKVTSRRLPVRGTTSLTL